MYSIHAHFNNTPHSGVQKSNTTVFKAVTAALGSNTKIKKKFKYVLLYYPTLVKKNGT